MCLQNRQTVRCRLCRVVIKTNLILDRVCDRVQGPHLQCDSVDTRDTVVDYSHCNKCLGFNGRFSVPFGPNANRQWQPAHSRNPTLSNSRLSFDTNNAGGFPLTTERGDRGAPSEGSFLSWTGGLLAFDGRTPASHGQYWAISSEPINPRAHGEMGTMPSRMPFNRLPQATARETVVAGVALGTSRGLAFQIPPQESQKRHTNTPGSLKADNIQRMSGLQLAATDEMLGHGDELDEQNARLLKMVADLDSDDGEGEEDELSIKDESMDQWLAGTTEWLDKARSSESQGDSGMQEPVDGTGLPGGIRRRTRRGTRAGRHVRARREQAEAEREQRQHRQFRQSGLSAVAKEFRPAHPPTGPRYQTQRP